MKFRKTFLLLALSIAGLSACESEVVPTTGPRPALSPDQVQFYAKPPYRYEDLGKIVIPITPDVKWDSSGNSKLGFARMREEAAARGANGILLQGDTGPDGQMVGAGDGTNYYLVPVQKNPRAAIVEAIFVVQK